MKNKPLITIRDFHGYRQHIEPFEKNGEEHYRWMFYVTGFCFDNIHCYVMKSNGTEEIVPIDSKDRILIMGKRYGRLHWNH